jgi:hypothetical protein
VGEGGGGGGADVMSHPSFRQHAPAGLMHTESDVGREVAGGEGLDVVKGGKEEWYSELEGLLKKARDAKRSLETKADRKVACPFKALTGKDSHMFPVKNFKALTVSLYLSLLSVSLSQCRTWQTTRGLAALLTSIGVTASRHPQARDVGMEHLVYAQTRSLGPRRRRIYTAQSMCGGRGT